MGSRTVVQSSGFWVYDLGMMNYGKKLEVLPLRGYDLGMRNYGKKLEVLPSRGWGRGQWHAQWPRLGIMAESWECYLRGGGIEGSGGRSGRVSSQEFWVLGVRSRD